MSEIQFHNLLQNPSHENLSQLERALGLALPSQYKDFLMATNGGVPSKAQFSFVGFFGHKNETIVRKFFSCDPKTPVEKSDLANTYRFYVNNERIPSDVLPIAIDIADNLICLDLRSGAAQSVVYWDHEYEFEKDNGLTVVFSDFMDFVSNLTSSEGN